MIPGIALLPFSLNFFVISLTNYTSTDSMNVIYISFIYIRTFISLCRMVGKN